MGNKHLEDHLNQLDLVQTQRLLQEIKKEEGGEYNFDPSLLTSDPELNEMLLSGHKDVLSRLEKSLEKKLNKGSN